jgi:Amt family ammonium transporter
MRKEAFLGISSFSFLLWLCLFAIRVAAGEAPEAPAPEAPPVPEAPPAPQIDTGDNAWMMTSSALVLAMTIPGVAFFYGGMASAKNMGNTMWMSFIAFSITSMIWVLWGYSLSFAPWTGFIGGLQWAALGVGRADPADYVGQVPSTLYATTIPHLTFCMFQLTFAAITLALVSGTIVERLKFGSWLLFCLLWMSGCYPVIAHWVWATDGWLYKLGALDFAGGTVVHIQSGAAGLMFCILLGRRKKILPPHSTPAVLLGASMLWFGWFGFNAGSAVAASGLAASAWTVTNTATATAAFTWNVMEWIFDKRPTVVGACTGAVAGLVAITPASGFVSVMPSIAIGAGAGFLCYSCVKWMKKALGYDDALDVVGVHAMGGSWGALATGLFASKLVNPAGDDGLFYGNPYQMVEQVIGVACAWAYSCACTTVLVLFIKGVTKGIRVPDAEEVTGLDITQHKEMAYHWYEAEAPTLKAS